MADVTRLPVRHDPKRFALELRLIALNAERDAALARPLSVIDHDIAAVRQELEARHGA